MYNQLLPYAVQLQLYIIISENKAATAPITFEETAMVTTILIIEH